jgi:hypothetical protein
MLIGFLSTSSRCASTEQKSVDTTRNPAAIMPLRQADHIERSPLLSASVLDGTGLGPMPTAS